MVLKNLFLPLAVQIFVQSKFRCRQAQTAVATCAVFGTSPPDLREFLVPENES